MTWSSILAKDAREHGFALFALSAGLLGVFALSLARQGASEFSMSSFQVVYFALLTILPLIAFILGNRLIVREYTGGTRQFMESLPIAPATPLVVKFFSGWLYLLAAGATLIALAALYADPAEYFDKRYITLLLVKTGAVLTILWSIVFFASITGKFRLIIYLATISALVYLVYLPGFDESRLPPIALMDSELFALERSIFPWRNLVLTMLLAAGISLAGFAMALVNEGSFADQLGKPLSKRNLVATGIVFIAILITADSLREQWDSTESDFGSDRVLRIADPDIQISYLSEDHLDQAQRALDKLQRSLRKLREEAGLETLPPLKVALNADMEKRLIHADYDQSIFITANFSNYNAYDHSMMSTVALHHMMLQLTNSRWDYESRHWMLDGFARWWAEGGEADNPHTAEYTARALLAKRRFKAHFNPLLEWQTTTEQHDFETAFALAFTALKYLQQTHGTATLNALAASYIHEKPHTSSLETLNTLITTDSQRFEALTDGSIEQFTQNWLDWLEQQRSNPAVQKLIDAVPDLYATVESTVDSTGVSWLEASYSPADGDAARADGKCVMRYKRTSVFDREEGIFNKDHDRQDCTTANPVHRIESPYASGDRAFVVLEYEAEGFNWPIRLWAGRVTVK